MRLDLFGYAFDLDEAFVDASIAEIRTQVRAYEDGDRRAFSLSVAFPDSFTGRVMAAMATIPYGETRSYGDLARVLETSPVAVGGACGRNPLPIVVPCHRVVGADSVGGFSAAGGVAAKEALLAHERGAPVQRTLG
ncbi:methylated-DNA--[protein]-cysteine S-methyltransferase [Salinigranum marinum]|uniref:methylated-DNA--[protein]-cysteine S-methyltransferase n=1 Tax=Salinigranum marinum TaxID=1515595 RepID=UPI002989C18D|nr:methylated-DNA--[protein]-cysteine S-methyltransferase [Salinigranum marinum]